MQNTGTLVGAAIRPADDQDTFATFFVEEGRGGYYAVANIAARNSIPAERRVEGLVVKLIDTGVRYELVGGIANSNWIVAQFKTPILIDTFEVIEKGINPNTGLSNTNQSVKEVGDKCAGVYSVDGKSYTLYYKGGDPTQLSNYEIIGWSRNPNI